MAARLLLPVSSHFCLSSLSCWGAEAWKRLAGGSKREIVSISPSASFPSHPRSSVHCSLLQQQQQPPPPPPLQHCVNKWNERQKLVFVVSVYIAFFLKTSAVISTWCPYTPLGFYIYMSRGKMESRCACTNTNHNTVCLYRPSLSAQICNLIIPWLKDLTLFLSCFWPLYFMNKLILLLKRNCGINEEGAHAALKMCFHANVWVYRIISRGTSS